jgi:hypothetical protein
MVTVLWPVPTLDACSPRSSHVRIRALLALAAAALAVAASGCGAELVPEELFAVPIERSFAPASGDPETDVPAQRALPPAEPEEQAAPAAEEPRDDPPPSTEDGTGEATAEPEDRGAEAASPAAEPAPAAAKPSRPTGPTDGQIAAFVKASTSTAVASDHRTLDVTGDGVRDVVVGARTLEGQVELILGTWDGDRVSESGTVAHPESTGLGVLAVSDLTADGRLELLLPYDDRPHVGVLVAAVSSRGELTAPSGCPVAAPTEQRLDLGSGPASVVLACHQRDARGRDGLVWADGVFAGALAVGGKGRPSDDG